MHEIETGDLRLSLVQAGDAPRFAVLCDNEAIARNTARIPRPYALEDAERFLAHAAQAIAAGTEYPFAVRRNGAIIACAGAMRDGPDAWEIGYWVGADYRRQGVAARAAQAVTQFVFETLGAREARSGYFVDNPASGRILTRVGFRATGEILAVHSIGRGGAAQSIRLVLPRARFKPFPDIVIRGRPA